MAAICQHHLARQIAVKDNSRKKLDFVILCHIKYNTKIASRVVHSLSFATNRVCLQPRSLQEWIIIVRDKRSREGIIRHEYETAVVVPWRTHRETMYLHRYRACTHSAIIISGCPLRTHAHSTTQAYSASSSIIAKIQNCYSMYTVSPKKHVTIFSTITLTISVRLQ